MDGMHKLHNIIERILNSEGDSRQDLIEAYQYFDFDGDDLIVIDAIRSLSTDFSFYDLFNKFKLEDRERLISLCMQSCISRLSKNIIDNMRKNGNVEYINIFK
jgi:Ca2+-binding EF-hand superfamily protein